MNTNISNDNRKCNIFWQYVKRYIYFLALKKINQQAMVLFGDHKYMVDEAIVKYSHQVNVVFEDEAVRRGTKQATDMHEFKTFIAVAVYL